MDPDYTDAQHIIDDVNAALAENKIHQSVADALLLLAQAIKMRHGQSGGN